MKFIPQKSIIYETERLLIRGLCHEDINSNYFNWLNDQDVCKYNSHGYFPNSIWSMESYIEEIERSKNTLVWAIVAKNDKIHIGNISLQSINWINRNAEFAILIGETAYLKKGFATEAASILFMHGFKKLNLHRIHCGTLSTNIGMQKLALRLGMKQEGIRRQNSFWEGQYVDEIEYGILREEYGT